MKRVIVSNSTNISVDIAKYEDLISWFSLKCSYELDYINQSTNEISLSYQVEFNSQPTGYCVDVTLFPSHIVVDAYNESASQYSGEVEYQKEYKTTIFTEDFDEADSVKKFKHLMETTILPAVDRFVYRKVYNKNSYAKELERNEFARNNPEMAFWV